MGAGRRQHRAVFGPVVRTLSALCVRRQRHSASVAVCVLTLIAVAAGHGQVTSAGDGGVETAGASVQRISLASGAHRFSPYDEVFRQYAGDQAGNDELIAIIAAATIPESGWNPERVGDDGRSVGLFQIHDVNGLSWADRADPERASAFMVPLFVAAYDEARATHPRLSGGDFASLVAATAERPEGWSDPDSAARARYRQSYLRLMSALGKT